MKKPREFTLTAMIAASTYQQAFAKLFESWDPKAKAEPLQEITEKS